MADQDLNTPDEGTQSEQPVEDQLFDLLNSDQITATQEAGEREGEEEEEREEEFQEEAQEAEEEGEQEEEESQEEESSKEEVHEGDDDFEFEIDGEKLTPQQLREGHLRHKDYTQKTQAVSEDRKALEVEQAEFTQQRQQVAQLLQQQLVDNGTELLKFKDFDWATLKEEDPEQFLVKKEELRDAQAAYQGKLNQIQGMQQHVQVEQQQAMAKFVQEEDVKLVGQIDGWDDAEKKPGVQKALLEYATAQGFEGQDLNAFADSRAMVILDKARQFDALQKAGKTVIDKKKAKGVKRVIKSGKPVPHKQKAASEQQKAKRSKLARSGSVDDAADIMLDWFNK